MRKRNLYIIGASVVAVVALIWWYKAQKAPLSEIVVPVKYGDFEISVNAAGELDP